MSGYLGVLKPAPGSNKKAKRLGRGDSSGKGNSSGRGQKGQKSRSDGNVHPRFEGGQTPLAKAFPKKGFTPVLSHPPQPLPLGRLQEWIAQGRIDASRPITLRELHVSDCVKGIKQGGVKLVGDRIGREAKTPLPPLQIMINQASKSAIKAIEDAGGSIVCRYYNALGVRAIIKPEAFLKKGKVIPRLADPIKKSDIGRYSDPVRRGYLALKALQMQSSTPQLISEADERGTGPHGVTEIHPEEDIPATTEERTAGT